MSGERKEAVSKYVEARAFAERILEPDLVIVGSEGTTEVGLARSDKKLR